MSDWLSISRGDAPLIISVPHAGTDIPGDILPALHNHELAISDADFFVDKLYQFATQHGVTIITTAISRTVIDVNRDPSGVSLYPGQTTTGLCPTERFDGTPLYREGREPDESEIARRRATYFNPYHSALHAEIDRLRAKHSKVVLYDAHSILSHVPRLFPGELLQFNIGSFDGKSCAPALTDAVSAACGDSQIVNGRFKGGWITRHYGAPERGIHAIQMELAMRGYLDEAGPWPPLWEPARAVPLQATLDHIITACLNFAKD
jgi:N-formylglutamate deformylase